MPKNVLSRLEPLVFAFLVLVLIVSTISCITIKVKPKDGSSTSAATTSAGDNTRPHPPVRTGDISLGLKVDLASQSIGASGGGISISKPGDPLDGFSIGVPDKAYPNNVTFKVSYAPITGQTFGDDFTPASPLITVDNGGGYSAKLMYVKVPVNIPSGYFAMGFLYDQKTKQLEGMPMIAQDEKSITVATRHFSNFLIGMIEQLKLKDTADSGFRPKIDDWQFTNYGSYIADSGHCEGQSLAAMWYYCTQPDGKDLCLYGRYDNNAKKPETPELWQDDSYGYRFCSVLQNDTDWQNYASDFWTGLAGRAWINLNNKWQWGNVSAAISDETTRNMFSYSMQMTGEPQEVIMQSESGSFHAMICFKVDKDNLCVADPNYYGITDRKIEFVGKQFKPYNSGANRAEIDAGRTINYEHIMYMAKSTIINWSLIAQRWTEFKNGTIGNDKFPQYEIVYQNEKNEWVTLPAGFNSKNKKISLGIKRLTGADPLANTFYRDGVKLTTNEIDLKPGSNQVGIYVTSKNEYVDFKYITINYQAEDTPAPVVNAPMPYTAAGSTLTLGYNFDAWKKSHSYYGGEQTVVHEVPITWNGLNFSGRKEQKPSNGTGISTLEISGSLSSLTNPDNKPVNLTMTYKATWDHNEGNFHTVGSVTYAITNMPVYIVAMTNQKGHWMLNPWPQENKGTALQKYLSSLTLKYAETYIGNPNTRPKNRTDQSWTYTDTACVNYAGTDSTGTYQNATQLSLNIRSPYNWQTKTDNK